MVQIPIKIGKEKWEIRSDERNWVLGKLVTVQEGKTKGQTNFVPWGWYSDLHGVAHGALEKKLKLSDAKTLQELQMILRESKDELKGLYETYV